MEKIDLDFNKFSINNDIYYTNLIHRLNCNFETFRKTNIIIYIKIDDALLELGIHNNNYIYKLYFQHYFFKLENDFYLSFINIFNIS